MDITSSRLTRAAGVSAVLSGLLFIVIQPIHPLEEVSNVSTGLWATVHYMTMAMGVLGLAGVTGIYLRQVKESGLLGLIGYLMFALFYLLLTAWTFAEALILPPLSAEAPEFVDSFLGVFDGSGGGTALGTLSAVGLVSFVLYLLGGVLLGVATFRARVLSRGGAILLAFGAASTLLVPLLPHAVARYAAVPLGLAVAWLGYSLWSEQRKSAARLRKGTPNEPLHQTSAA